MAPAITWFQIPATDMARATKFYETICDIKLEPMDAGPGMQMAGFPADWRAGEIGGAVVCGDGAVPSATGTAVFLNGNPDLQAVLDRVAGGRRHHPHAEDGHRHGGRRPLRDDHRHRGQHRRPALAGVRRGWRSS